MSPLQITVSEAEVEQSSPEQLRALCVARLEQMRNGEAAKDGQMFRLSPDAAPLLLTDGGEWTGRLEIVSEEKP